MTTLPETVAKALNKKDDLKRPAGAHPDAPPTKSVKALKSQRQREKKKEALRAISAQQKKDRGTGKGQGPRLPKVLIDQIAVNADGTKNCYRYQMGCCQNKTTTDAHGNVACEKGQHRCMVKVVETSCGKSKSVCKDRFNKE